MYGIHLVGSGVVDAFEKANEVLDGRIVRLRGEVDDGVFEDCADDGSFFRMYKRGRSSCSIDSSITGGESRHSKKGVTVA